MLALAAWPTYDEEKTVDSEKTIVIQFNGKIRGKMQCPAGESKENIIAAVKSDPEYDKYFEGKQLIKEIHVPDRLVNFVVK